MAWGTSNRKQRLPNDWHVIQPTVLKRDRHRCQHIRVDTGRKCGAFANQVDHIKNGDDHRYSNLQSLCEYHHKVKSSQEGGTASAAARRARDKAKHPGLN